jgi:hypothetical protein
MADSSPNQHPAASMLWLTRSQSKAHAAGPLRKAKAGRLFGGMLQEDCDAAGASGIVGLRGGAGFGEAVGWGGDCEIDWKNDVSGACMAARR